MIKTNFDILKKILEDNKNTEFGKKYKFSEINSIEEYKNNIQISNYYHYKSYIDKMYNGEENILTSYQIENFNCTSGSEGQPKLIPITKKAFDTYYDLLKRKKNKIFSENKRKNEKGKRLLIGLICIDLNKKQDKYMLISEAYYYYLYKNKYLDEEEYIGGKDLMFDPYTSDYLYEKVWCAIIEENIILIESVYMYDILQFFNMFEKNYKEIISDIRNGIINPEKKLSEKAKNILLNLKFSEERLNFVEKECEKGFDGIAGRIWKNLKLIKGISSKVFVSENKALKKYIGNIPKEASLFGMSEGFVGISLENNNYSYYLEPSFGFYEFIPFSENENENLNLTKDINEIEENKMYELILTNLSGLYRYETGDIIKIVKKDKKGIFFEFCFRKNLLLNIAGEKTNFNQVEKVMRKMEKIIPNIAEYSLGCTIYENVGTYFLFLSLSGNLPKDFNLDKIQKEFDLMLCKVNYVYKYLRNLNCLGEPKIFLMNKEKYNEIIRSNPDKKCHNKPKLFYQNTL